MGTLQVGLSPKLSPGNRVLFALMTRIGEILRRFGYQPFAERCSWCRRDLPVGTAFYIGGRRVCAPCAERGRRRMVRAAWAYIVLSAILLVLAVVGAVRTFLRGDPDAWLAVPVLLIIAIVPLGLLWIAIRVMKSDNQWASQHEQLISEFKESQALLDWARSKHEQLLAEVKESQALLNSRRSRSADTDT